MKISDKFHLEDINRLKNTVLTGKTEDIKLADPTSQYSF